MEKLDRAAVPVIEDEHGESAWAEFGKDYEKRVLARLARNAELLVPNPGEDGLSERLAIAFLRRDKKAAYASQMNLRPRQSPALLAGAPSVRVRRTYADLVWCMEDVSHPLFRVIDIKATRRATTFHKAQVAFYARMLEAVLKEAGLHGAIDQIGSIWRIPDDTDAEDDAWQEEDFQLAPYLRMVDDFCTQHLPMIASKGVSPGFDETFFHIYFKCEQCEYLKHCMKTIDRSLPPDRMDVSAVPGLTHEAKRGLRIANMRDVAALANASGLRQMNIGGWSLTRRAEILVGRAKAIAGNEILRAAEGYTFLMPPRIDVGFYLLTDSDPVDGGLVTLGYLKVENDQGEEHIVVLPNADRKEEADALVNIFTRLISDLEKIHRANEHTTDDNGVYSHIFFYEPSEAITLQDAVKRHLDDPRVREGLLHMVRLFPPEHVTPEPAFRGMHHLPATALRSVVEQLYFLPVVVSYDLRQVSCALYDLNLVTTAYLPTNQFKRAFSSLLSIDVCRALRQRRTGGVTVGAVEDDVRARLQATRAIAEWLLRENRQTQESGGRAMLRLAKKPFRLQATFNPLQAGDLDILRALELLENRSGLLDALVRLAQPVAARRDAQRCVAGMRLQAAQQVGGYYHLEFDVPAESRDAEISSDSFGLILTDDDPDLRLTPGFWKDLSCNVVEGRPGDPPGRLRIRMFANNFQSATFQMVIRRSVDRSWCLDQSFFDVNSAHADRFLSYLADGGDHDGAR